MITYKDVSKNMNESSVGGHVAVEYYFQLPERVMANPTLAPDMHGNGGVKYTRITPAMIVDLVDRGNIRWWLEDGSDGQLIAQVIEDYVDTLFDYEEDRELRLGHEEQSYIKKCEKAIKYLDGEIDRKIAREDKHRGVKRKFKGGLKDIFKRFVDGE